MNPLPKDHLAARCERARASANPILIKVPDGPLVNYPRPGGVEAAYCAVTGQRVVDEVAF